MTWFGVGSAVVSTAVSAANASSSAKAGARAAGAQSLAEGQAIQKERLNTTIRNAYSTAAQQMQLGLRKKQLAQQGAGITAAALAAKGDVAVGNASTSSIGASTAAVVSDINMKAQEALDSTTDEFENVVDNYNTNLNMMVLNTEQSATAPRDVQYLGPSRGEMLGGAVMSGVAQFASGYAQRKMSLGLGATPAASNVGALGTSNLGYSSWQSNAPWMAP